MIQLVLQLIFTVILAFITGKLVSRFKLPSILGWLITGMIAGPYALSLINGSMMEAKWYQVTIHILECTVGLMIGTELVWKRLEKIGKVYYGNDAYPVFGNFSAGVTYIRSLYST